MTSLYPVPWLNQKQNKTETKAKQKSKGWSISTQTGKIPIPCPMGSGFPGGSDGEESACNAGDPGSVLGSGSSPGGGNGNPLQDSCLESPMDRGAWWAAVHEIENSQTLPSD